MGTKVFRIVFALCLAFSAIGFSASTVFAAAPVSYEYPAETFASIEDMCPFHIDLHSTFQVRDTYFLDKNGVATMEIVHATGVDTFTANGKTLTGLPYTLNIFWTFDQSGNLHVYTAGVITRVPLPDGSTFFAAGRVDASANPFAIYFTPDSGHSTNVAALCAALAP
jgi:hypothetical protein